jgi:GT2 family glycosyltransferase/glycosyltransferase involved in cell wall biosynthesis
MNLFRTKNNHYDLLVEFVDQEFIEFQLDKKFSSIKKCVIFFEKNKKLDPCPSFSRESYLAEHKDVDSAGMDPFLHYLLHGKTEGRHIYPSRYALKYRGAEKIMELEIESKIESGMEPEIESGMDPEIESKIESEIITKFNASKEMSNGFFDGNYYEKENPGVWGWEHYVHYGQYENKAPNRNVIPEVLEKYFRNGKDTIPLLNMIDIAKEYEGHKINNEPVLSIVILNWNKSLMTLQCVYTIFKNSYSKNIEIIVVDNGSRDEEFSKLIALRAYPSVKIIRNKSNRFYGEANNIGVEASTSEYICLLNNDAFVGYEWDKYLLEELKTSDDIGGVGPKFLFPDGKLQEAGGQLNPCGQNVQVGKGLDPNISFFNRKADVTHVSAACFILSKALFNRVNGFDYRYEPAYYEDADLTAKIATLGYKIRYVPKAEVIHVENATSKEPDIGFNFGSLISTNRLKFVEKWGDYLRGGEAPYIPDFTSEYSEKTIESDKQQKIAVIYSPYNLTPGGGERYVLSLALAAKSNGYKTYFCSPEKYSKYRLHTISHELGLDVSGILLLSEDELDSMFDVSLFIAMSNELSPSIKARGKDKNIYHCQFPFPMSDWHKANCINNITGYDKVIVNSEFTKAAYIREATNYYVDIPEVEVVSPPVSMIENIGKSQDNIVRILNVGRFIAGGHCKKQKELVVAFSELSSKLEEQGIESKMTLVGSLGSGEDDRRYLQEIYKLAGPNVEIVLNASRKTVIEKYQESSFYWHGTGIGENVEQNPEVFEHFGITPVEAMSAGCTPIVWHQGGPMEVIKSLGIDEKAYCATTVSEYVDKTLALIGRDFSINPNDFSEDVFLEKLEVCINEKA